MALFPSAFGLEQTTANRLLMSWYAAPREAFLEAFSTVFKGLPRFSIYFRGFSLVFKSFLEVFEVEIARCEPFRAPFGPSGGWRRKKLRGKERAEDAAAFELHVV